MAKLKKFIYGFTANDKRCIIHAFGRKDRASDWKKLYNDPRYKPGKTEIAAFLGMSTTITDHNELAELCRVIASGKPKKFGAVVYDDIAFESASTGMKYLKGMGINTDIFRDLDSLFKWLDE